MADDAKIADVRRKIQRERQLMDGYSRMRQAAENQNVQSQVEAQIREGQRNIQYFESTLQDLIKRVNSTTITQNGASTAAIAGQLGNYGRAGPQPSPYSTQGGQYGRERATYGDGGPGGYSNIDTNQGMPSRSPFGPQAPGSPAAKGRPTYSKLGMSRELALSMSFANYREPDLIKYDTPHLGPRIQLMLSQLEFKLSVERQYKDGIDKIIGSYRMDGDKKIRQEASNRRTESMQKIQLLQRALKRHEDLHVDDETPDAQDGEQCRTQSL